MEDSPARLLVCTAGQGFAIGPRCPRCTQLGGPSFTRAAANRSRQVLVLYADRPLLSTEIGAGLGGRFGYSDLKEAAFSGAAALWELDGI